MQATGAVKSTPTDVDERTEAFERLRYVALHGHCGLLVGPQAAGKTFMLRRLAQELRREGQTVSEVNLVGLTPDEFPFQVASQFGFGIDPFDTVGSLWALLQDYAESHREIGTRSILLFDHVDRTGQHVVPQLDRLLALFRESSSCLFAARPSIDSHLERTLIPHATLKIELPRLNQAWGVQIIADRLRVMQARLSISPEAVDLLQSLANGRPQLLDHLTELCALAAETEEHQTITAELVQAVAEEFGVTAAA